MSLKIKKVNTVAGEVCWVWRKRGAVDKNLAERDHEGNRAETEACVEMEKK